MKQAKSRYNYDPSQPLSKQYQDAQVFNAYYKCFDVQTNKNYLLSHFKTQNKTQISSLFKKFNTIKDKMQQGMDTKYITQIHDIFLENKGKSLFLVLDYSEGGSIIDYIGKVYTLQCKTAIRVILGALYGLLELHKFQILNCFINLQNIQIDQSGTPKLSFKCMIYKTIYLSPQFRKQHVKSRHSDIYCLGVCLYRLIFGIFPFKTQKNEQLIQIVRKGPLLSVQKDDSMLPIVCSSQIRQILKDILNLSPQQRLNSIQKFQQYSKDLNQANILPQQIYLKFFKSKYINIYTSVDQIDEHQYSILDTKQKKLLKLLVYNANNNQIESYLKNVITKFAKLPGDSFVKIYEYQILQQQYLALVYSYCGQGTLAEYRKNIDQGFGAKIIDNSIQFLKGSLKSLDSPYKYLTNQSIYLKNGNLRIKFPQFQTVKYVNKHKRIYSSGQAYFIAPQILAGQQSKKCDSWSIGVMQYWMIFNQMPKFDNKNTLLINKKQKLSKNKLLYFHSAIEMNPNTRLNVLNDQQVKSKLKLDQNTGNQNRNEIKRSESPTRVINVKKQNKEQQSPSKISNNKQSYRRGQQPMKVSYVGSSQVNKQSPIKGSNAKLYGIGLQDQSNENVSVQKQQKARRTKKRDTVPIDSNINNPNLLPNRIQYQEPIHSKYKSPIIVQSKAPLPQKNPNKFDMKMFNQAQQIKTPQNIQPVQKVIPKQQNLSLFQQIQTYTIKLRSKLATLQRSYTKSIRVSIKCLIVILFYVFLFYFNFFKTSGSLIGSRQSYQTKIVQIRAFATDSIPNINYTLVTKTPTQTNLLFYNTTVPVLRDQYKCVLNDYSVKSNVVQVIKTQGFVAYQVFGFIIAFINIILMCIVIARYDLCKVCHITNFEEKKYHTLINYGIIVFSLFSLTSFHYLIYGGLYHLMLEPCIGKTNLPGLQFLLKNWVSSWIVRFIWPYIGIVIAYSIIIFFLIKPLKKFNKFVYLGFLVLYFCGVGIRGMGKSHPAYQNVFGVCGQLLGLIVAIFLFFTDLAFACFSKAKTQQKMENNIDTRSIQDFNRTQQFLFGDGQKDNQYNEK